MTEFTIRLNAAHPYKPVPRRGGLVIYKTVEAETEEQATEIAKAEAQAALDQAAKTLLRIV